MIFENKELKDASFLVNPEGEFIPPHELKEPDKTLNGFAWHGELRPVLEDFERPRIEGISDNVIEEKSIDLELKGATDKPQMLIPKKKKRKKASIKKKRNK